jgi:hypothetical protein
MRTGDADLRLYITTMQDGCRKSAFLTRWNSVHLQILLSATPQRKMFPELSYPQALLGSLVSIYWKFQFTKIVSEFVINFKKHSIKVDGCFKKSFTSLKAYRNLYRGHTQRFELSKCSKIHRVLPWIVIRNCFDLFFRFLLHGKKELEMELDSAAI